MTKKLDLGMMIGYWGAGPPVGTPELIAEAERLGFRSIWTAEAYGSEHYTLPYPAGTGLGKAVRSITHPLREDLPIYLAAEGPKNVALAAEIADGWLSIYFSPRVDGFYRDALTEGFGRPGARRS